MKQTLKSFHNVLKACNYISAPERILIHLPSAYIVLNDVSSTILFTLLTHVILKIALWKI